MATTATELDLAIELQKEKRNNSDGSNTQNQTSSNDAPPLKWGDMDFDQFVKRLEKAEKPLKHSIILKTSPRKVRRKRAESEPECPTTSELLSLPLQRRFSTTDANKRTWNPQSMNWIDAGVADHDEACDLLIVIGWLRLHHPNVYKRIRSRIHIANIIASFVGTIEPTDLSDLSRREARTPRKSHFVTMPTFSSSIEFRPVPLMERVKAPVKPIHNTQLIFYIYFDSKINGPLTCDEIISLYVYNQIQEDTIYIVSATTGDIDNEWHKLEIPHNWTGLADLSPADWSGAFTKIEEEFPQLYEALIMNIFSGELKKIGPPPLTIPEEVQKGKSIRSSFVPFLGKLLALFTLIIMLLHLLPFIPLSFVYLVIMKCACPRCVESNKGFMVVYFIMFSGFVAPPLIMTWLLLFKFDYYDEIQSWMIAYIVWGVCSFVLGMVYIVLYVLMDSPKQKKYINSINKVVFFIVAIDFGALDIVSIITNVSFEDIFLGKAMGLVTLFLTVPLASLLPSAISGFIANYILEEKFELKCRDDIVNTDICFESLDYGCCEVISSHNWRNSYAFMGGLA
eukprot:2069_1